MASWLLPAFRSYLQSRLRDYFRHLGLVLSVVKCSQGSGYYPHLGLVVNTRGCFRHLGPDLSVVNCSHGSVAITRIWVLFAVKAAWLFSAFGFCLVCSQL